MSWTADNARDHADREEEMIHDLPLFGIQWTKITDPQLSFPHASRHQRGGGGMTATSLHGARSRTGGNLSKPVIVTATPYMFGLIAVWNTTTVLDGSYTLQSVATDTSGVPGASPGITGLSTTRKCD
jgi:hypothetical protein